MNIDALNFPRLLPGHKWEVIREGWDSAYCRWSDVKITIRRNRKHFDWVVGQYEYVLDVATFWERDRADGEEVRTFATREEEWTQAIVEYASRIHAKYVADHKIPMKSNLLDNVVDNVSYGLNRGLVSKDES